MQMLLYPHSDANSDDDRLERLADPQLAKRLRKANPKFFTRAGHSSIVRLLALAGIVSLVSGYFIEPLIIAPYRDRETMLTTNVRHVPPVPPRVTVRHHAPPPAHVKSVVTVPQRTIVVQPPEPAPQVQPEKQVQRRARAAPITQTQPNVQANNEEAFWLKAQAQARARDRAAMAKAVAASAAVPQPVQAPVQAPVDTQMPSDPKPLPPANDPRPPGPWGKHWPAPTIPGGPCSIGRGTILQGIGGILINSVLQNAAPVHHTKPFGRP